MLNPKGVPKLEHVPCHHNLEHQKNISVGKFGGTLSSKVVKKSWKMQMECLIQMFLYIPMALIMKNFVYAREHTALL